MTSQTTRRGLSVLATACLAASSFSALSGAHAAGAELKPVYTDVSFVPVTQTRILDTRYMTGAAADLASVKNGLTADNALNPMIASGAVINMTDGAGTATGILEKIAGKDLEDVTAVVANITITDAVDDGYASAPASQGQSNVNYVKGGISSNTATIKTDSSGGLVNAISVYSKQQAHVIIDILGYYTSSAFNSSNIGRVWDSRDDMKYPGAKMLAAKETLDVDLSSKAPANAVAAILNITSTKSTDDGYITAFTTGANMPATSNVNYKAGQIVPNSAVVKLDSSKKVSLYTMSNTHIVVDVLGFLIGTAPTTKADHTTVAIDPVRLYDSREEAGDTNTSKQFRTVKVAGVQGLPENVTKIYANVTIDDATEAGFATVAKHLEGTVKTSQLNYVEGDTKANAFPVEVDMFGNIDVYTHGAAEVIIDVVGYETKPKSGPRDLELDKGDFKLIQSNRASYTHADPIVFDKQVDALLVPILDTTGDGTSEYDLVKSDWSTAAANKIVLKDANNVSTELTLTDIDHDGDAATPTIPGIAGGDAALTGLADGDYTLKLYRKAKTTTLNTPAKVSAEYTLTVGEKATTDTHINVPLPQDLTATYYMELTNDKAPEFGQKLILSDGTQQTIAGANLTINPQTASIATGLTGKAHNYGTTSAEFDLPISNGIINSLEAVTFWPTADQIMQSAPDAKTGPVGINITLNGALSAAPNGMALVKQANVWVMVEEKPGDPLVP